MRAPAKGIFLRYLKVLSTLVAVAIVSIGAVQVVISYRDETRRIDQVQQAEARATASRIDEYLKSIERQARDSAHVSLSSGLIGPEEQLVELRRLLKVLPPIFEIRRLDSDGRELVYVSRTELDRVKARRELDPARQSLLANTMPVAYGVAYFVNGTEPFASVALREADTAAGVIVAEVNLRFVADVVSSIRVGEEGDAYVVDNADHLLAHRNKRLLLSETDLSNASQVRAVRTALKSERAGSLPTQWARSPDGRDVLTSAALIPSTGWLVFVEQPVGEALRSVRNTLLGTLALLVIGLAASLAASLLLSRRLTRPILSLQRGAARIGSGDLNARLDVKTGDELELLASEFNRMAEKLKDYTAGLEEKVADKTAELQLANRHKSEFLANMSHELRTPLNAIIGFSEVLKEQMFGHLNAKQDEYVRDIHASGLHLLSLINDILDLSKVEAGRMELDCQEFAIGPVLENAITLIRERAQRGQVKVELQLTGEIDSIVADERKFKQILINLLSNAVKFTRPGGRVTVSAAQDADGLQVAVSDTGVGIAASDLPHIFQEFRQIRSAGDAKFEGTGLGLALTKRFVELHGGRIHVQSELGRGSSFTFWLPRSASE